MSEKSLIIIEAPSYISDAARNICHKDLVEMRESGVILLPHNFKVVYTEPYCIEENDNSIGFVHESAVK